MSIPTAQQPSPSLIIFKIMSAKAKTTHSIPHQPVAERPALQEFGIKEGTGNFGYTTETSPITARRINKEMVLSPLNTIEMTNSIDVTVSVTGGGGTGQAGAICHGLSRARKK